MTEGGDGAGLMPVAAEYLPGADVLDAECYLVSRGVRPLALIGHCPAQPLLIARVRQGCMKRRQRRP